MEQVYINGKFIPRSEAKIPIEDRGFRFGDGVFETISVYENIPYQWELHMERLKAGLSTLKIDCDTTSLISIAMELLNKNQLGDGLLRVAISRGSGSKGYLPTYISDPTIIIETMPKPTPQPSVDVWLTPSKKPHTTPLSSIKSANGLFYILARIEAEEQGCSEALVLNDKEELCECSASNLFWFSGNSLHTPALECASLPGTMRDAVLRISPYEIQEGHYNLDSLKEANEVFVTNVAWQILPVKSLKPEGLTWDDTSKTEKLRECLREDIATYIQQHRAAVA